MLDDALGVRSARDVPFFAAIRSRACGGEYEVLVTGHVTESFALPLPHRVAPPRPWFIGGTMAKADTLPVQI